jgi:hypothetical protein
MSLSARNNNVEPSTSFQRSGVGSKKTMFLRQAIEHECRGRNRIQFESTPRKEQSYVFADTYMEKSKGGIISRTKSDALREAQNTILVAARPALTNPQIFGNFQFDSGVKTRSSALIGKFYKEVIFTSIFYLRLSRNITGSRQTDTISFLLFQPNHPEYLSLNAQKLFGGPSMAGLQMKEERKMFNTFSVSESAQRALRISPLSAEAFPALVRIDPTSLTVRF